MKTRFKLSAVLYCLIALTASAQKSNYDDIYFSTKDYNNAVIQQNNSNYNLDYNSKTPTDNQNFNDNLDKAADNFQNNISNSGIDYYNNLYNTKKDSNLQTTNINITNNYNDNNLNYSSDNYGLYGNRNYYSYNNNGSRRLRNRSFFCNTFFSCYPSNYFNSCYNYYPYQFGLMGCYGNNFYNQNMFNNYWPYSSFYGLGYNNCWNNFGYNYGFGYNPFYNSYYSNNYGINQYHKDKNIVHYGTRTSSTGSGSGLSAPVRNPLTSSTTRKDLISNEQNTINNNGKISEKIFNNDIPSSNLYQNHSLLDPKFEKKSNPDNTFKEKIEKEISSNQNTQKIENSIKHADYNSINENKNLNSLYNQEPKTNRQQPSNSEKTYKNYMPEKTREYYERRESFNNTGNPSFGNLNETKGNIYINDQPKRANSYERPQINPNTYIQPREAAKENNSQNQIRSKNYDAPVFDRNTINTERNHFNNDPRNSRKAIEYNNINEPRQNSNPTYRNNNRPANQDYSPSQRSNNPGNVSSPSQFNGGNHNSNPSNIRNVR